MSDKKNIWRDAATTTTTLTIEKMQKALDGVEQAMENDRKIESYYRKLPDGTRMDGLVWMKDQTGRYPGAWITEEQYEQFKALTKDSV